MIEEVQKTDSTWDKIIDTLLSSVNKMIEAREPLLKLKIHQLSNRNIKSSFSSQTNIVLCPLFEIEDGQLIPKGLKNLRNELYKSPEFNFNTIFLIANRSDMPDPFNPHKDMTCYAKNLIRNPKFGGMGKALLMLELIFKQKEVINIVDIYSKKLLDDILLAIMAVNEISQFKCYYGWRARFYETFVKFYDDFENANKTHIDLNAPEDLTKTATMDKNITWENLQQANVFYNDLHCALKQRQSAHHVPLELFRAPIPFPLQELVDAKNEIGKKLNDGDKDNKIRLLLIDNRSDNKFISKNGDSSNLKPESLCNLLFSENNGFGLSDIFEMQMIGKSVYKKKDNDNDNAPQFYQNGNDTELSNYSDFKGEYEEFKFKKFKNKIPLTKCEKEYHKAFINKQNTSEIENYADLVYHKIKDADFVLLDFFLDNDNTYLAFDFIRDIADIKRKQGDVSTTWYFITSAVYDSVVKYSQSGLLAEYYESAVVSAGDDPTNKKRQIIFLYKLLTFINSRLKSFARYKDIIFGRILGPCPHENVKNRKECCVNVGIDVCKDERVPIEAMGEGECDKNNCLEYLQVCIKRYLTEFDNIASIFYGENSKKYMRIAERLDDTITKFLLLPEADWQIIQHQIDYINARLEGVGDRGRFSCSYILDEITTRSEIY